MSETQNGRAMFDNESGHPDELSFSKGDKLSVLRKDIEGAPGWWLCKKGNTIGIAPGNFIEIIPSSPSVKPKDNRLDFIDQRSSRAPSGEYSHPRNPKLCLGEGESQLNVCHKQVDGAFNRVSTYYSSEVSRCDEYDVMKWGAIVRHFWTLCDNLSSSVLLFTKFVRSSVLETIDENVDFVVVGKLSNKLNLLDLDYQGYANLLKIIRLQFNENTPSNINGLMERGERIPAQVNELYATLKANKMMFFSENPPKWAGKRVVRRASYEDVDCLDFLTQAIEIRNRNEVNIDIPEPKMVQSRKSAPSSPNRITEPAPLKGRSRSRTELIPKKLSVQNVSSGKLKLSNDSLDSGKERKFSISQHLSKLKIKPNKQSLFKSTKINSVNKIEISNPTNPQMLNSVSSDFALSKARAVTMTTPDMPKRRATESDIIEGIAISQDGNYDRLKAPLPLSPGLYEPMSGASNFPFVAPSREGLSKDRLYNVSLLTELYLQLEQVLTAVKECDRNIKMSQTDPLVYTPWVQHMTTQVYKGIFLIQVTNNTFQSGKNVALITQTDKLTEVARNFIISCKVSLKIESFDTKNNSELVGLSDKLTNQVSDTINAVMRVRDDAMS